ncbi:pentapeptide repeat-containing protein [Microcoleus sp. FACHB-53]|nr:pentapeptide repeat-containing protein [Microcoleus sp. FACHB-53]
MANLEHIDILYEGADAWNNWRKESPQIKPDISKCDLYKVSRYWMFAHISITSKELNFSETDMREVRFKGMNEFIFDFTHSNLSNVDLSQRKLRWANLNNADLSYAQLRGTNLFRAKLIDAKLTNTNLTHANLIEAELNNAELHYANLNKAKLCRAKLIKSNLYKANLSGAKLGNSDMRNADLRGADLSNTNLYSVNIQKAYFDEETIFPQDFNPLNAGMIYLSVDYENSNLIEKLLINKKEKKYINPPPRPGQVEFRENVRKAYDNKCAISGCGIEEVLQQIAGN